MASEEHRREGRSLRELAGRWRRLPKEDRLVFSLCLFNGFAPPWVPVNGIIGMLEQIWRGGLRKFIHNGFNYTLRGLTFPVGYV